MKKIHGSTDLKEDDKNTCSTISTCFVGDKKLALKVKISTGALKKDDMMKTNSTLPPKIPICCLDEEAIQKKLAASKRKLHESYEQASTAKNSQVYIHRRPAIPI
ncbi:hypothetical protein FRX31_013828 [Thalictrum thalictroides]|uniref:Uncharacterized protein n=1 Tax=Thalictrum thalictroides TaxID=46969 RepID=A0A7J6WGM5_THATH|nr:hypothetical protein FRX31_013828 [Thalictrum thalictroides]